MEVDDGVATLKEGAMVEDEGPDENDNDADERANKTTSIKSDVMISKSGVKMKDDVEVKSSTPNGDLGESNDDEICEEKTADKSSDVAAVIVDVKSYAADGDEVQPMEVDGDDRTVGKETDELNDSNTDKENVHEVEEEKTKADVKVDDGKTTSEEKTKENEDDELEIRKRAEENEQKEAEILEQLGKVDEMNDDKKEGKEQTIIITETKSLAKAINEAVKKPDGKPTLVIIESKSNNANSTSSASTPTTPTGSKAKMAALNSPGTGMTLRSRSRMEAQANSTGSHSSPTSSKTPRTRTDNSNIALKDDADINIYTPSLMVPYIYECAPKEKLSDFLTKIGAYKKKEEVKEPEKMEEEKKSDDPSVTQNGEQPKKEKTYFDTTLGQYFLDIGLLQAQRWVQYEVLRVEKRKLDKGWSTKERKSMVFTLKKTLGDIENQVSPFIFKLKTCTRCDFKTESQTVLDRHLETIHVTGNRMNCSHCEFNTVEPSQIFQHLFSVHKAYGRLERPPALHQCPLCPVEDSAKARVTRHMWKCAKSFVPDKNQAPSNDFEPPAKRIRHVATVATLKAMRAGSSVDKMSSAAALTTNQILQMQQNRNSLTGHGAQRPQPPPIRPKPGDIRLSPAYVQSVLRGQYMSSANVRGLTSSMVSGAQGSLMRPTMPQRGIQQPATSTTGAYMLRQSNPVITSINTLTNPLQASQLFQVINPSAAGGLVPLVRSGTIGGLNAQRFTILPTPPVTINNRGPTPVALIPNLVTTSKTTASIPTSLSAASVQQHLRSSQAANQNSAAAGKVGSQKPNISITPVNKPMNKFNVSNVANKLSSGSSSTSSTAGSTPSNRPNQSQSQQQGNSLYVVCEICDGYIKDLDQLRNHMQWIHKVKIHPKMIHNRPPLNCQKCHFRFFTDQGLERHLLGSHGLVTSSMQENANKGKDGGRCIICGKVFLWKLVVHMAKDHKMTLKPAHLSYKCTVCSATFNMYRLFETHVYDEHSTVAKRVLDGQKSVGASPLFAQTSAGAALVAAKPKVNTPSNQINLTQQLRRNEQNANSTASSKTTPASAKETASGPKPATSRITLHPEPRTCDDCSVTFKRGGNCDRHWEPTKLKPCNANLCRVDKCDACLVKSVSANSNAKTNISNSSAAATSSGKVAANAAATKMPQQKTSANGKQTEKVINKEKTQTKPQAEKTQPAPPPPPTKVQAQSDGEDVFDMEVETVDENGSSPGYGRSDVESD